MADLMTFPDTVEEFMNSYKMVDREQIYSNGVEYVPIFRMEQWFEHEKYMRSESERDAALSSEDFGTLAICAIRYCQGRQTYMPDLVRDIIRPYLSLLSDKDLSVMIDDCGFQKKHDLYGDEKIDKPGWVEWEDELLRERSKRAAENK